MIAPVALWRCRFAVLQPGGDGRLDGQCWISGATCARPTPLPAVTGSDTDGAGKGTPVSDLLALPGDPDTLMERRRALVERYEAAIAEVVEAVRWRLEQGAKPSRARAPSVSVFGNRMPTISDGDWSGGGGPPDHVALLEPPYGDDAARQRGRYPPNDFPELAALVACVAADGDLSVAFPPGEHAELLGILLRLQVEGAANLHFLRFGPVAWSRASARVILPPLLKGLFDPRLDLAVVVPIALTRFEPGRVRAALGDRPWCPRPIAAGRGRRSARRPDPSDRDVARDSTADHRGAAIPRPVEDRP